LITHVNTVTIYVSDQQQSLDFYVDVLGFEKRSDRDMGSAGRWIEVAPAGAQTGLVLASGAAFEKTDRIGDSADLVFATDNLDEVYGRLRSRPATVSAPDRQAWGASIEVTDPDGLVVLIMQHR
jgi:catechol 2,3-dioxygenase-like lactoylglutathione lyase family enzyme